MLRTRVVSLVGMLACAPLPALAQSSTLIAYGAPASGSYEPSDTPVRGRAAHIPASQWDYGEAAPPPEWRGEYAATPQGRGYWYVPAPEEYREQQRPNRGLQEATPRTTQVRREVDPRFHRQVVPYEGREAPGTIVIRQSERHLYLVQPGGTAMRYGIGVGRDGFGWSGVKTVSRKAEWPDWRPPSEMLQRRPDLPRFMPGGPSNPLGARAMYLGSSLYRIHGTNEPHTIGTAVSSGCFRLMNEDVMDLYSRVKLGAKVIVM
jgi:lipoprotein-anchoring transpeptidase ErfK/SrfK